MGYHELTGSKLSLKKPILVLKKIQLQNEEEDGDDPDSKRVELDVIGVIRHKILFKTRPKALISSSKEIHLLFVCNYFSIKIFMCSLFRYILKLLFVLYNGNIASKCVILEF